MEGQLGEAVELLAAATRRLLEADRTRPSSRELLDELSGVEVVRRQLEALSHLQVAELGDRKIAAEQARTSTAELLVQLLRLSPAEARLRVARAGDLGPRRGLQGQPWEPIYPRLADAQRHGAVSAAQVSLIIKTLDAVPAQVSYEVVPAAEQFLVEHAQQLNPKPLGIVAARLLASIDPDGAEPRDEEFQRRRGLHLRTQPDGSSLPSGYLTPDCTAALQAVLDPLSRPVTSADGIGDDRNPAQRRHDALLELSHRILRSGTCPTPAACQPPSSSPSPTSNSATAAVSRSPATAPPSPSRPRSRWPTRPRSTPSTSTRTAACSTTAAAAAWPPRASAAR